MNCAEEDHASSATQRAVRQRNAQRQGLAGGERQAQADQTNGAGEHRIELHRIVITELHS